MNHDMSSTVEFVGPALAGKYLDLMKDNRSVRQGRIVNLVNDMRAGRWRLTHQGIAFDWDGHLRDGQHRLLAIIESGMTVPIMVTRNVNPAVFDAVDIGAKRSFTDAEVLAGNPIKAAHEATLRSMFTLLDQSKGRAASVPALREMWAKHSLAIQFAVGLFGSGSQGRFPKGTNNATIRAVVARAYYGNSHQRLQAFAKCIETGLMSNPHDEAAIKLRDVMLGIRSAGKNPQQMYRKTERALFSFLQHQSLRKVYEATEELFPIEGEPGWKPGLRSLTVADLSVTEGHTA